MKIKTATALRFAIFLATTLTFVIVSGCQPDRNDPSRHEGTGGDRESQAKEHPGIAEDHSLHEGLRDSVAHQSIVLLETVYRTPPATRHRMAVVLEGYGRLRDAPANGDSGKADHAAEQMARAVSGVPTSELRDAGREAWNQHAELYSQTLGELQHVVSLTEKRSYFAHIGEIVYCTVRSFGLGEMLSHVFFCPMALDGKGAYWLSEDTEVRNPFFGESMVECGEEVERLGP